VIENPGISDEVKNGQLERLWLTELFPISCADPETSSLVAALFKDSPLNWRYVRYSGQEASTFDLRDRLPSISTRSLILAGAHDNMPLQKAKEMRAGIHDSEVIVFERSGHFAPIEEPDRFRAVVFNFLDVR